MVQNGGTGNGIYCTEYFMADARYCATTGGACTYIEVDPFGAPVAHASEREGSQETEIVYVY